MVEKKFYNDLKETDKQKTISGINHLRECENENKKIGLQEHILEKKTEI